MSAAYQLSKMVIPGTDVELDMVTYVDGDGTGRTRCLECESEFEHLETRRAASLFSATWISTTAGSGGNDDRPTEEAP